MRYKQASVPDLKAIISYLPSAAIGITKGLADSMLISSSMVLA
jgi:hypothetical protein